MTSSPRILPVKGLYNTQPQMVALIIQFIKNGYSYQNAAWFSAQELWDLLDEGVSEKCRS